VVVVAHSCVYSWWTAVHDRPPPPAWERYRRAVAAGIHAASVVVAPTRAMLASLAPHYGAPDRSLVIHNAARPDPLATPAAHVERRPLIFAAGRVWDEAKNLRTLAQVAPSLPWPVVIAGEPTPPGGAAGVSIDGAEVEGGPRLLGRLAPDDVARWMREAAIYALPARYEPFGLSALEAALRGCALVLGDIPSLREVWGRAAAFVPPDDDEALRATLQRLSRDPAERARLAGAARAQAASYMPEIMGDSYRALYRALTTGGIDCAS
jgi:glycosyltransferase involved in cell wall biosynthesis